MFAPAIEENDLSSRDLSFSVQPGAKGLQRRKSVEGRRSEMFEPILILNRSFREEASVYGGTNVSEGKFHESFQCYELSVRYPGLSLRSE